MFSTVPIQATGDLGGSIAEMNEARDWTQSQASDAVTEPIATIPPTANVEDAVEAFVASGASHVMVCEPESEWPVGVIGDSDLIR